MQRTALAEMKKKLVEWSAWHLKRKLKEVPVGTNRMDVMLLLTQLLGPSFQ